MTVFKKIFNFYVDGFKNQSKSSRKLWFIILIKLFIMFAILKVFFFKDFLKSKELNEKEKSEYIINNLTKQNDEPN
ncbi:MAG: DUF4492 domain-containing protein [Bacteroidales bacterium]|nr:DUF4492 domain-containing protein [Bacteroidales bacterium]